VRGCEEACGSGEGEWIRNPAGDGRVGVVFDEQKGAAGAEIRVEGGEEGALVADIVERVGHEDAVETLEAGVGGGEVGCVGIDGDAGGRLFADVGMKVDGFDGAAGRQEISEGEREGPGPAAEIGPVLGGVRESGPAGGGEGAQGRMIDEGDGFAVCHGAKIRRRTENGRRVGGAGRSCVRDRQERLACNRAKRRLRTRRRVAKQRRRSSEPDPRSGERPLCAD